MEAFKRFFKNKVVSQKWLLSMDVILATVFTFFVIWVLGKIIFNVSAFDPLELALKDTDLTDVYYSRIKPNEGITAKKHPNIILVNISHVNRQTIANALTVIGHKNPKVIGLDCNFPSLKSNAAIIDTQLKWAMERLPQLVTAKSFMAEEKDEKDDKNKLEEVGSNQFFELGDKEGYSNFLVKDEGTTVRYYAPFINFGGKREEAFTSKILKKYNSETYGILENRNNLSEKINYDWRKDDFITFQMSEITDSNPNLAVLENKIVLMGYTGDPMFPASLEDEHITPLNRNYLGHGLPDTYGSIIHANILAMTLSGNYIDTVPEAVICILSVAICLLQMIVLIIVFVRKHIWYHIFGKLMQFIVTVSFVALSIWLIAHRIKLDTTTLILPVILSVDLLYFYEGLVNLFNSLYGHPTYFTFHGHVEITGQTEDHVKTNT